MPIERSFKTISAAVNNPELKPHNPHFLLCLLGTDTQFVPKPTKPDAKHYESGETLSHAAQFVAQHLGENNPEIDVKKGSDLSFLTPSVAIINGPSTFGEEVGDRIVLGIFLSLNAIAEGKQHLNFIAHSRGAVEAILIAHELERIKKELAANPQKSIYDILLDTPCKNYTQVSVKKYFKPNDILEADASKILSQRLEKCKLSLFLMDPVPGASKLGSRWIDKRFYKKVPCDKIEQIILRDERTGYFEPLIPADVEPVILPGHHGTASGNFFDQQYQSIKSDIVSNDTTLTQQLTVYRLMRFLNDTKLFDKTKAPVSTNHPTLDKLANDCIKATPEERTKKFLELYDALHENDLAYRHFTTTYYEGLSYFTDPRMRWVYDSKNVKDGVVNYTPMDQSITPMVGRFVNMEHINFHLQVHTGCSVDSNTELSKLAENLKKIILELFEQYVDKKPSVVQMFNHKESRQKIFSVISSLMDQLGYAQLLKLQGDSVKTKLLDIFDDLFESIDKLLAKTADPETALIIKQCRLTLHVGISHVSRKHYNSLIEESIAIQSAVHAEIPQEQVFDYFYKLSILHEHLANLIDGGNRVELLAHGKTYDEDLKELQQSVDKCSKLKSDNLVRKEAEEHLTILKNSQLKLDFNLLELNKRRVMDKAIEFFRLHQVSLLPQLDKLESKFVKRVKTLALAFTAIDNGDEIVLEKPIQQLHAHQIKQKDDLIKANKVIIDKQKKTIIDKEFSIKEQREKIDQLKTLGDDAQATIKQLKKDSESLSKQLELANTEKDVAEAKNKKSVASLVQVQEKYDTDLNIHNKSLKELSVNNTQLSKSMENLKARLEKTQAQLNISQSNGSKLDAQFKITKEQNAMLKSQLEEALQRNVQFDEQLKQARQQINQLAQNNYSSLDNTIKLLQQENHELKQVNSALKKLVDTQTNSANQLKDAQFANTTYARVIDELKSSKETSYANLLEIKLKPLTIEYWMHLVKEVQKIVPNCKLKSPVDVLPDLAKTATLVQKTSYDKLSKKYLAVQDLFNQLNNPLVNLPSERIKNFSAHLQNKNAELVLHRDPIWMQYFKTCLVALSVVCSLIIPGIAALLVYSSAKNKSSPLFFTKSMGEEYADKANNLIQQQVLN